MLCLSIKRNYLNDFSHERLLKSILIATIPIILLGGTIKLFVPYFFDNILNMLLFLIIPNKHKNIIREFSTLTDSIRKIISKNKYQINSLTQTRDALLPKLMSGEIRV